MNDMREIDAEADGHDLLRQRFHRMQALTRSGVAPVLAERRDRLDRLREMLLAYEDEFIAAISADFCHRSPHESRLLDVVMSLNAVRNARRNLKRWMRDDRRHVDLAYQPAKAWVRYEPLGVIGIISPWNYPLFLALGPLVDALAAGNRAITNLPPEGETYTHGTPNVWSGIAIDETLGMVYLPLGNATPDYYGGQRRDFDDDYNAALVALILETGREAWRFRTMNHGIWDYDLPSQPALADLPDGKGGSSPPAPAGM